MEVLGSSSYVSWILYACNDNYFVNTLGKEVVDKCNCCALRRVDVFRLSATSSSLKTAMSFLLKHALDSVHLPQTRILLEFLHDFHNSTIGRAIMLTEKTPKSALLFERLFSKKDSITLTCWWMCYFSINFLKLNCKWINMWKQTTDRKRQLTFDFFSFYIICKQ